MICRSDPCCLTLVSWVAVHLKIGRHVWYFWYASITWLWYCDDYCPDTLGPTNETNETCSSEHDDMALDQHLQLPFLRGKTSIPSCCFHMKCSRGPPGVLSHLHIAPARWRAKSRLLRRNTLPWDAQHRSAPGHACCGLMVRRQQRLWKTSQHEQTRGSSVNFKQQSFGREYGTSIFVGMLVLFRWSEFITKYRWLESQPNEHYGPHRMFLVAPVCTGHVWFTQGQLFLWLLGSTVSMTYQTLHHCCAVASGSTRNTFCFWVCLIGYLKIGWFMSIHES